MDAQTKAKEILRKIKEAKANGTKQQGSNKVANTTEPVKGTNTLGSNNFNRKSNTVCNVTANGDLHRLLQVAEYSIETTKQQEETLYLHWQAKMLSIRLALPKRFVLPLSVTKYNNLYRVLFPKFSLQLNSCTMYLPELVSYIALHCTYIQQVVDIYIEYLTGLSMQQQEVIYKYLLAYKGTHNATNKSIQSTAGKITFPFKSGKSAFLPA